MKIYVMVNEHNDQVGCYSTKALALKAVEDYFNEHVDKDYFPDGLEEFLGELCRIKRVTLVTPPASKHYWR